MHPDKKGESHDPKGNQEYEEKGSWHHALPKALVRADRVIRTQKSGK
jgi:hypothetical protein